MTAAAGGSPAERYAAFRRNQVGPALSTFEASYPFGLDPFQRAACRALEDGRGVLVAAPTGAGKTVVGEFAVQLALAAGRKCFYTTPIKALSNQKYNDLTVRYGTERVGLLTGDNAVNPEAPVVVMTTEVLRNMLYARSRTLVGLSYVVMDEVHYLADRARGAVWEEVIIHLPEHVTLVSLSATVSNAEEFAEWLVTVRGDTEVVVEEHRPVPLWQHVLVGTRLLDLFAASTSGSARSEPDLNPELVRLTRDADRWSARDRRERPVRPSSPSRADVVERLARAGLLPAITFIFSRAGCAAAVDQCVRAGLRLNSEDEAARVREVVAIRTAALPRQDLRVLGFWEWQDGLQRGLAAHHAGMLPTFKEVVEELFLAGLVKAVFATETLALGINMPARSVVLEKLSKWNGETHVDVTAGEYTQLTGRAGRRGIDVEGHAVVLWRPGLDPAAVAGLASTRTYPLRSSFRPSYNMAVNLVGGVGREPARALLESSFAQFQADRSVVGLARQVAKNLEAMTGYTEAMTCHLGDAREYGELRAALKRRETELSRSGTATRRAATAQSLERLVPGHVIHVPGGRRAGLAVVLDPGVTSGADPHPLVLTASRWAGRLALTDFPVPVIPLGQLKVPRTFNHRSPPARRDLAAALRALNISAPTRARRASSAADDDVLAELRGRLRQHPVHGCAEREQHLRWIERWARLRTDTDALERRVAGKTSSIARTFDRVCEVLTTLGYLSNDAVTDTGRQLASVYSEADLLVVECLSSGVWDHLAPAELAAVTAALVYESRRSEDTAPRIPPGPVAAALAQMVRTWGRLAETESAAHLSFLREPDPGFCWLIWRWASGASLDDVLSEQPDQTAGDFVRTCKQLVDLLSQIAAVAGGDSPVRKASYEAIDRVRRGVVASGTVA